MDNPLKGLVPYQADVRALFPHSLEFNYLPFSALVKGDGEFDWGPLERLLDDVAGRGHQAVLRIYLEYPGKTDAIPAFLVRGGLKVTRWRYSEAGPRPPAVETPDYEDRALRKSLRGFVAAFGKKYDGDPRVGFLTAGLLGLWGEWHDHPKGELFASKAVQLEVMDAYAAAFKTTPVLLRYPAGPEDRLKAENAGRGFGYHDDSFAWATLHTGKASDGWFYMTALKAAGPDAGAKWKTRPIGGEIRPEAWGRVFDETPGRKEVQDFRECVQATHVTWLMDSGMFRKDQKPDRIERAGREVRRMGYEFHAPAVTVGEVKGGKLGVRLEIENRGVAPFYYDWRAEWGLLADGKAVKTWPASGKLTGLLPGDRPRAWADALDVTGVRAGKCTLAVRVPNPMKAGKPVRFANKSQDAAAPGWLSLGEVEIP
ncbi:MAG: DUF4832 domain-containing protein [Gemmataceae bacterium]